MVAMVEAVMGLAEVVMAKAEVATATAAGAMVTAVAARDWVAVAMEKVAAARGVADRAPGKVAAMAEEKGSYGDSTGMPCNRLRHALLCFL